MTITEIEERARFDSIRYAQCWEDPAVNSIALNINRKDNVVSIASGGDNTFALVLDGPQSIVGVDINPIQIAVCELKKTAINHMDYDDFLEFLGISKSDDRVRLYRLIRSYLSSFTRDYFDSHLDLIHKGLVHSGKFEVYLRHFRTKVLKFAQSRKTVYRLLSSKSLEAQRNIYCGLWDNRKWRLLAKVFLSKFVMGRIGRDPAFFKYVSTSSVSEKMLNRIKHGLTNLLICDNYYVHYILTGNYINEKCMPPYLLKENYKKIKARLSRVTFIVGTVEGYIKKQPKGMISKINFSNIFEYMSDKTMSNIFDVLLCYCRDDLILEYRTLFVHRDCPESHERYFLNDAALGKRLSFNDRSFFYGDYVVLKRK
jgi:S-adenosylmethionine-diacylglycerol 3-amino-3-carboxypropyl transferase